MSIRDRRVKLTSLGAVLAATLALALPADRAGAGPPAFSNTALISTWSPPSGLTTQPNANSTGNSEPAITFGAHGRMALDGLSWLPEQVNTWTGEFGSTPTYFGAMDAQPLPTPGAGRTTLGDEDADIDIATTGTMHLADLDAIFNANGGFTQLGVSVTNCPPSASGPAGCTSQILDTAGADRPWLTSLGRRVWVAYHDAGNSTLIHVKKSVDDGVTWTNSGNPITGQDGTTGQSTFNNSLGPIVADPTTGDVFEAFMAGEPQTKGSSANYNNVYIARSTDGGAHYTDKLLFHAAPFTRLNNFWPATAVDALTGAVYVAWTDQHGVSLMTSHNHGASWTGPITVSTATTTVMPTVAARGGKVDVLYYGSHASSVDDTSAVWNTYDSQRLPGGSWTIKKVSNTPNRVGAICLEGSACPGNKDRELLDLFEAAEDPISGKLAVIYTDTTIDTWTFNGTTKQLPEIVLAFEN
ncbi:MAG TPA: sialidase family protein [Mycobacterium sp.]|jgi:hypothetical protein|nr:sialidase family protein [Mycobacterium sp.]